MTLCSRSKPASEEQTRDSQPIPSPDLQEKMKFQCPDRTLRKEYKLGDGAKTTDSVKCQFCGKVFPDNDSFTIHLKKHNNRHKCKECNKTLSSASSLDRHMYVHSGKRPFKCKLCPVSFTTSGNMRRHMRNSHSAQYSPKSDSYVPMSENDKQSKKFSPVKRKQSDLETDLIPENSEGDVERTAKRFAFKKRTGEASEVFTCPVCLEMCMSLELFQLHMEIHPDNAITCPSCKVVSANYKSYEIHSCTQCESQSVEESPPAGFQGMSKDYEFSSKNFPRLARNACEEHPRCPNNTSITFKCFCGLAFPCKRSLNLHEAGHKVDTFCYICRCDFASLKELKDHQWLKHNCMDDYKNLKPSSSSKVEKDTFMATLGLLADVSVKSSSEGVPLPEEFCSLSSSDSECVEGQLTVAETSNDLADIPSIISLTSSVPCMTTSQISSSELSAELKMDFPAVESSTSNNSTDTSTSKAVSVQENSEDMKINFESKEQLEPELKFSCKQCQFHFPTSRELKQHAKSHSQSGQPYQCSFCSYQSSDRSTLTRHMLTHNGERPFKCSLCDFAFTTKANSIRHVKKKHKLPESQAADAVIYNPNISESGALINATNDSNSTETVCKYCNTDFKNNRVLRHHLRSVSNSCHNKPFLCQICSLGFSTKNNCTRHISKQHPECIMVKELIVVNMPSQSLQYETGEVNNSDECVEKQFAEELQNVGTDSSNSGEVSHFEELDIQSSSTEDDRVYAAQCLVKLSQTVVHQELPLDLSLRAMDLSSKSSIPRKFSIGESYSSPTSKSLSSVPSRAENRLSNIQPAHSSPFQYMTEVSAESNSNILSPFGINGSRSDIQPARSAANDTRPDIQPAHSSPVVTRFSEFARFDQLIVSPIKTLQNEGQIPVSESAPASSPLMCLTQNLSAIPCPPVVDNSCAFVPNANISISLPIESSNQSYENVEYSMKDKIKLSRNPKTKCVKCDYCEAFFTLKSNKERHIKNKHREYARPARSRNYIPSLSNDSVKSNSSSMVSDETRDALRGVLNTKANSSSSNNVLNLALRKAECIVNGNLGESRDHEMRNMYGVDVENGSENVDLASVSSVISTANSKKVQQYLKEAENCDLINRASDTSVLSKRKYDYDEKIYLSSLDENLKKESSYSKHKKSIQCNFCNKTFPWESSFQRHLLTHTGDKPYSCKNCDQEFTTKSNCNRHVYRSHMMSEMIAEA
ncbi:Ras-responsive element-binding protein 1, partial [Stegodyphus mimosarum]